MRGANAHTAQFVREVLEAALLAQGVDDAGPLGGEAGGGAQTLGVAEEELDVPEFGEVGFHEVEKVALGFGEGVVGEEFDQVAEVVAAVEGEPVYFGAEGEAGGCQEGAELVDRDPHF